MNKKRDKFVGAALSESAASTYTRIRIGTVIVRGAKIVSRGANLCTSHPLQKRFNTLASRDAPAHALHSEMHAIVNAKGKVLTGCTLYVARLDRRGLWADCRPCPACSLAIRMAGIALVVYTSPKGIHTIKAEDL